MKQLPKEARDVLAVLALGAGAALGPLSASADGPAAWCLQLGVQPAPAGVNDEAAVRGDAPPSVRQDLIMCLQQPPAPAPVGYALVEADRGGAAVGGQGGASRFVCDGWGLPLGILHVDRHARTAAHISSEGSAHHATRFAS